MALVKEEWQARVLDEKDALLEKLEKLEKFITSDAFANLAHAERIRLDRQVKIMQLYDQVLYERINAFALENMGLPDGI
jgi:hypothetical protein